MTLAIIAQFFYLPTNVHWHLLKVNSIRSSPCHGQCQLGQEHSDFVIFGTQGVRKLPKKLEEHKYVGVLWSEMIEIPSVLLAADFLQYPPPKISDQEFAWRLFCRKSCQSFTSFRIGYNSFDLHHNILAISWFLRIDDRSLTHSDGWRYVAIK